MTEYEIQRALLAGAAYFYKREPANRVPIPTGMAALPGGLEGRALSGGFEARAYQVDGNIVISYAGTYFPGNGLVGEIQANGMSDAATSSVRDWLANLNLGIGGLDQQLVEAAKFYLDATATGSGLAI